ncbi:hypothetical protein B0A50_06628 [Salinomyces thailandicus]|uniref:Uncharacterized protein n=1 Tax=Salinomyces thailandicus TaxID=706561 RepID=A0A4U0TQR8_9PEZI|nr:hypothetical protein B0A50_06628 [Salinomyces thailandica]
MLTTIQHGRYSALSTDGLIAYTTADRIYAYDVRTHQSTELSSETKGLRSLQWLEYDSDLLALIYTNSVVLLSIDRPSGLFRINNGSKPSGDIATIAQLSPNLVLVIWDFGRAGLVDLQARKTFEIGNLKTSCDGSPYAIRRTATGRTTLAYLRREGAEDALCIRADTGVVLKETKLPTADAQSISWSPDGRWLAVLDTPIAPTGTKVYFYTPDAKAYTTFPRPPHQWTDDLGIKELTWPQATSSPSEPQALLALSGHSSELVLLDTRKFSPIAILDHTSNTLQPLHSNENKPIWQETVSASGERSYEALRQPVNPIVTRVKDTTDPKELGTAEVAISSDARYIATRDGRYQSTIWLWNASAHGAHEAFTLCALLFQHRHVRKMSWHPIWTSLLLIDCGESNAYLYDVSRPQEPPAVLSLPIPGNLTLKWIAHRDLKDLILLAASKSTWCLMYPNREPHEQLGDSAEHVHQMDDDEEQAENLHDSLHQILTGRTPMPRKSEASYTEMVDLEAESDVTGRLDDTFREKGKKEAVSVGVPDPLDDSEIF